MMEVTQDAWALLQSPEPLAGADKLAVARELAAMRSQRDSAHNANQAMADALAAKDALIIQLGENAAKAAGEYAEEVARLREAVSELTDALENLVIAIGMGWDLDGVVDAANKVIAQHKETANV